MREEEKDTTFWENVANTTWGNYISDIERQAVYEVSTIAKARGPIVDLGCEGGRWSKMLLNLGWTDVICADIDLSTLKLCHRRLPKALCIHLEPSASVIPCKTGSIGLLVCMEVFPVIHSHWFIDESFRVLRPGGLVLGVLHNSFSYRAIIHRVLNILNSPGNREVNAHYKVSYYEWRRRLSQKGFKIVYEKGFCWLPFPRFSNVHIIPQLVKIEKYFKLENIPSLSPWIIFIAMKL